MKRTFVAIFVLAATLLPSTPARAEDLAAAKRDLSRASRLLNQGRIREARAAFVKAEAEGASGTLIYDLDRRLADAEDRQLANTVDRRKPLRTHSATGGPSSSTVSNDFAGLVKTLSPLTEGFDRSGPASIRLHINGRLWNSMSHDQQQQLLDSVAVRQVVHDTHCTIHVIVYSTDVGTIGPGWTGEWKFRRND